MLKIKDNVDLKELKKFGFEKTENYSRTHKCLFENGKEDYYTETTYRYDNGLNTIEILEKRENSDWKHMNKEREIYVNSNDYDIGISKDTLDKLYDLIQAGLVEKVEEER